MSTLRVHPPKRQRSVDYQRLGRVAARVQLVDVLTQRFSAESSRPLLGVDPTSLAQRFEVRGSRLETEPDVVAVQVEFVHLARIADEQLARIEGALTLVYTLGSGDSTPLDDVDLDLFAEVNGVYNAWPYLRELVGSCAGRLGLGGMVLPVWQPPDELPPLGQAMVLQTSAVN